MSQLKEGVTVDFASRRSADDDRQFDDVFVKLETRTLNNQFLFRTRVLENSLFTYGGQQIRSHGVLKLYYYRQFDDVFVKLETRTVKSQCFSISIQNTLHRYAINDGAPRWV